MPKLSTLRFLPVFLALVFTSCRSSSEKIESDPAFGQYIAAHTAGVVTTDVQIQIVFTQVPGKPGTPGAMIEGEVFDFSPNIKGQAVWVDDHTVAFVPEEQLPRETKYRVEFDLRAFFDVPDELSTFLFEFQTAKQKYSLLGYSLRTLESAQLQWNELSGSIATADVANIEELQELIYLKEGKNKVPLSFSSVSSYMHSFSLDSLERRETARHFTLHLGEEDTVPVRIPSLSEFEVLSVRVIQQPTQYVVVSFSDPIGERQNFTGLFRIGKQEISQVQVENAEVRLYPDSRVVGNQELVISAGVLNIMGFKFPETYREVLTFDAHKPEVRFVGKGNITPLSGSLNMPFEAIGLRAVDVMVYKIYADNVTQFFQVNERVGGNYQLRRVGRPILTKRIDLTPGPGGDLHNWSTYGLQLDELINPDPGAIYRIALQFRKSYSLYPCEGESQDEVLPLDVNFDQPLNEYDEYYEYEGYWDGYEWEHRDNPCHVSYYGRNHFVEKNILATDIGLMVKETTKGEYLVYTNNLKTAEAMSGVTIDLLNYQKQSLVSGSTDANGKVKLNAPGKVFMAVAKSGKQRAYLRIQPGESLPVSNFDVGGEAVLDGIKGFLYTERGVWRPGDSIFANFILQDADNPLPASHPLVFEFWDPQGKVIKKQVVNRGKNYVFPIRLKTGKDAPTGTYRLTAQAGGTAFGKNLKVENIKPNRLKIDVDAASGALGDGNSLRVHAEWLTGLPVSNLRVTMEASVSRGPGFKNFKEYNFWDQTRSLPYMDRELFDGNLDGSGNLSFVPNFGQMSQAPGPLSLNVLTKVFEASGDFSIDGTSIPLHPFKHYVGIKAPETPRTGWLETGKDHFFEIVRTDASGRPEGSGLLKVKVYKVNWSWWWNMERGGAAYLGGESSTLTEQTDVSLTNGKARFSLNKSNNDWGRYYVVAEDPDGHRSGSMVYLDWPYGMDRSSRPSGGAATMLTFQTDKDKYQAGDKARITVPTAKGGRVLLSLENGTSQLSEEWKTAEGPETVFEVPITADMSPTIYAWVHFIQPHERTTNDMPIRLYGVIPLQVEDAASHLYPQLSVPSSVRPNSTMNAEVKEKNGRPMEYTLAVVDEGLLSLTRFQTPTPWDHFYRREALGVRTYDFYDEVIGAFGGKLDGLLAIGGDAALMNNSKREAERFKPVVRFLGPFRLSAGEVKNHKISIPNYIGSVRVMVIAADKKAYGHADKNVPVKQPVMALLTAPRVLGPGERVQIPVTVFAMEKNVTVVEIRLKGTGPLILRKSSARLNFTAPGEKTAFLEVEAKPKEGKATLAVEVDAGNEKTIAQVEFDVRGAVPPYIKTQDTLLAPGSSASFPVKAFGLEGANALYVEVSSMPDLDLSKMLNYLQAYPHSCSEQLVSKAFPHLFVGKLQPLSPNEKLRTDQLIREVLSHLRIRQMPNGGIRLWTSDPWPHPWVTSYAGHFLLEAEKAGYDLPIGLKQQWLSYQQQMARKWSENAPADRPYYLESDQEQAYRLFTLALAGTPELGAMNRLKNKRLSSQATWRLAAAYALAGQRNVALDMVQRAETSFDVKPGDQTYGSPIRDKAMVVETLIYLGRKESADRLIRDLIKNRGSNWYTSQNTAYTLLALSKLYSEHKGTPLMLTYNLKDQTGTINTSGLVQRKALKPVENGLLKLQNTGKDPVFVQVVQKGRPMEYPEPPHNRRIHLQVRYETLDGKEVDISNLKAGTEFTATVTIQRSEAREAYDNLALSQIFPSGWEIVNKRLLGMDQPRYNVRQDIQDDRVYTYFDLRNSTTVTFEVDLVATYSGRFYLPPTKVEAMYDPDIQAMTEGKWVEVSPER